MRVDLPSQRYALLVEQLGQRLKHRRGWHSSVATELGVDRSFIWRIANKKRAVVSEETIDKAIATLGISRAFFTDADVSEPWFGEYITETRNLRPSEEGSRPATLAESYGEGRVKSFVNVHLAHRKRTTLEEISDQLFKLYGLAKFEFRTSEELNEMMYAIAGTILDLPLFVAAREIVHGEPSDEDRWMLVGMMLTSIDSLLGQRDAAADEVGKAETNTTDEK